MEERQNTTGQKKTKFNSKYVKIGIVAFVVIALSIVFYFSFFDSHTLFGFIGSIWSNLSPFIVGAVLAYLLKPVCEMFEKLTSRWFAGMSNKYRAAKYTTTVSIAFTIIVFLLLIYILFAAVIPQLSESISLLIDTAPDLFDNVITWIHDITKGSPDIQQTIEEAMGSAETAMTDFLKSLFSTESESLINGLTIGVKGIVSVLKNVLIGLISAVYILGQRKKFGKQCKMIVYSVFSRKWADKIMDETKFVDKMFSGFINGKIIDSLIIGVISFIVLSIFRMPYVMLISVIIGITNVIPFFGPYIGAIPSAFLILMVSPIKCLYFIIIIVVIQQFDGNILGPKILGNATGVSSFWVLFSIIFFGGMWGFIGMIIGVPLFAVLYDIVKRLVKHGLDKRGGIQYFEDYQQEKRQEELAIEQTKLQKIEKRKNRIQSFRKK